LGLAPGWLSWGTVAVGVVAAFLLAGLAGLAGGARLPARVVVGIGAAPAG
jgi:hypothetical protein